jgi:hypothetical protein
MTRLILVPAPTADGRHVILRAVVISPVESLRRLLRSLIR